MQQQNKSCYILINEFNAMASVLPPEVHQKITRGEKPTVAECGEKLPEVKTAVDIWNAIQERLNLIPQYDLMVQ